MYLTSNDLNVFIQSEEWGSFLELVGMGLIFLGDGGGSFTHLYAV